MLLTKPLDFEYLVTTMANRILTSVLLVKRVSMEFLVLPVHSIWLVNYHYYLKLMVRAPLHYFSDLLNDLFDRVHPAFRVIE